MKTKTANQIHIDVFTILMHTWTKTNSSHTFIYQNSWLEKSHLFYNSNWRSVNLQLHTCTRPCYLTLVRQDKFNALIKYAFFGAILPSLFSMWCKVTFTWWGNLVHQSSIKINICPSI